MNLKRRIFLKMGMLQAAVMMVPESSESAAQALSVSKKRHAFSVLQGATDGSRTQFSVVHDRRVPLYIEVTDQAGQLLEPDKIDVITFKNHPKCITRVRFSELVTHKNFLLNLKHAETGELLDQREFSTLDADSDHLRVGLVSCMKHEFHKADIWQDLARQKPDVLFFIGDAVYTDAGLLPGTGADPYKLWDTFCDSRSTLDIYHQYRLTPILAVWDDHDYGQNDSGGEYRYKKESERNFLNFFAQEEDHCEFWSRGPGISGVLRLGVQTFIMLDDRSFREKGYNNRYSSWGQEQEEWMLDQVMQSRGPVWLMNGNQFFPVTPSESVARSFPKQLKAVVNEFKKFNHQITFISGDVHYSEISYLEPALLGYPTYEITSSGLHTPCMPWEPYFVKNPRRVASTGRRNYILLDLRMKDNVTETLVRSCSPRGRVNFSRKIRVS